MVSGDDLRSGETRRRERRRNRLRWRKTRKRERGVKRGKRGQRNCRRGEDKFSLRLRREIIYSLDTSDPVTPGITL